MMLTPVTSTVAVFVAASVADHLTLPLPLGISLTCITVVVAAVAAPGCSRAMLPVAADAGRNRF